MVNEESLQKYKRSIEEFCLMDDTFMAAVFNGEIELTQMLLRIIMGNDKIKVIKSVGQYAIKNLQGRQGN